MKGHPHNPSCPPHHTSLSGTLDFFQETPLKERKMSGLSEPLEVASSPRVGIEVALLALVTGAHLLA